MTQPSHRQSTQLPLHITYRQRKFREFYQQQDSNHKPHSLENMILPVRRQRKKLPISGEYGQKKQDGQLRRSHLPTEYYKHSVEEVNFIPEYDREQHDFHKESSPIMPYLRLKQIKRRNSLEYNGPAYVKETDEQLEQRAKEFVKLLQNKKSRARRSSLLGKGQYEQRLIDSQIRQCQQTILQNQRLMQRQARIEERLKYLKHSNVYRGRYQRDQTPMQEYRNSVNLPPKLSKNLQEIEHKHRSNRQSLNLSENSQRQDLFSSQQRERVSNEPDQCNDYFQNENKNMLKKLITLVQKKERLIYLSSLEATPSHYI